MTEDTKIVASDISASTSGYVVGLFSEKVTYRWRSLLSLLIIVFSRIGKYIKVETFHKENASTFFLGRVIDQAIDNRDLPYKPDITSRAAAKVLSISASVWAMEVKPASNWEGAK